ncbi:MAG: hypothetical protein ACOYYI_09545 [Chloroflexota bacterium]
MAAFISPASAQLTEDHIRQVLPMASKQTRREAESFLAGLANLTRLAETELRALINGYLRNAGH